MNRISFRAAQWAYDMQEYTGWDEEDAGQESAESDTDEGEDLDSD